MDDNHVDKTFDTTQYYKTFQRYVENTCSSKNGCLPVAILMTVPSNNLFPSAIPFRSG